MEEIRSWWEVPCIAHYCYLFRNAFKLPPFEIEELEDALLVDHTPDPSSLLVEINSVFLTGICGKQVTEENWSFMLKLHLEWRVDYLKESFNPLAGEQEYKNLTTREKVELLHKLCHWRLELDDIGDLLKGLEALDLRLEPLGKDGQGHVYWYFYGTRLYREPVENYKQRARAKMPVVSSTQSSSRSSGGRKKPSKSNKAVEPEATEENDSSKDEWELLCSTSDEWEELTESFRGSKQSYERSLYKALNEELLPDVLQMITAKEKRYKKKLLMDAPRRQSSRIALKTEEHLAALEREKEREERRRIELEELRIQEEEAAEDRRKAEEEARKKAEEEAKMLEKVRKQEEEKWEMALSGELSGPRKAAIGAQENATAVANPEATEIDRDEELYTSMYKVCSDIRKHEDGWIFVDPVTDDIAPGYSEIIKEPMDIVTIEQKLSDSKYSCLKEFVDDFTLIFDNCYEYNGADSEYAEVADTVKKYFKKLCKRYFNEVYLKEKEEKERTPSPEHEKALKDLEEESESDDSSGSESDTSEFGVSKKSKRNQKGKAGEKGQPEMDPSVAGMWPRGMGRGAMGPNGLTINAGTLENLQRLAPQGNYPPRMPPHGLPSLPPNAPPHVQQEYYAKLQMMQQRQRYMAEMMRRHHHQQQQQRGGYPRYPPGMEGMPPAHMQHGMPPRPNHPEAYSNMMGPPNYPYPGDHMMRPPYQQQHPHAYRGHYPPYHNYPNNPQEHYRMPPPDYNEAAKEWNKGYKGMPPSQGEEDNSVQSPSGTKSRQTSVSSDGMGVKSPPTNANAVQSSHSNSPMDTQASTAVTTPAAAAQGKDAAKGDNVTAGEKDETDASNVDQAAAAAKPPSEAGSTDAVTPTTSANQSVNSEAVTSTAKQQQQQPDYEAYKRGMEAAYKYHQEQMRRKQQQHPQQQQHHPQQQQQQQQHPQQQQQQQHPQQQQQHPQQQQQLPPPGYSPGHMTGDMNYGKKPHHQQQQMLTPKQQESYMQWRQHQEAMWRSQQMGMPTPPPVGSPYSRTPPGPMYDNHGYHNMEGAEAPEAYKQQQQQHDYHQQMQQQQYMMNRRYMEDMYRQQQRYGHPGMHAGSSPYPYGHHHPGYPRPPYHSPMDKQNADGNPMQPTGSPHLKPDATAPGEEIPDYTDSLRKYAIGLTGSSDKNATNSIKDKERNNSVSSNKEEEKSSSEKDQEKTESSEAPEASNGDKDNKTENKKLSGEVESASADSETKPLAEEKEDAPAATDDKRKEANKSAPTDVTSPTSSFPAADSTTHDGSTPEHISNPQSRPSSQPGVGTAQNGHKGHYPTSMYPPQNAYGGWDGMQMQHMGYNRGMYPPSPMGRPENMEEYERYRMYHEQQMMAMRQMPPQDPYHGMGMPPGMSPYEMEQYHYSMMQGRMGGGPPQMGRGGYPTEGEQQQQQQHYHKQHGMSQEEMKRYQMKQQEHHMAMQHQMRTAYHHQQQQHHHHGSPYGPSSMGPPPSMPPDYPGISSPSSATAASMAGGQHQKMSAPSNQQAMQQKQLPMPTMAGTDNAAEFNDKSQEASSNNKGTEEPPSKKAKLDC